MKKLICLCLVLIIFCPLALAKDMYTEGEDAACEYLGVSRDELSTMLMAEGLATIFVAIVRKIKEIEERLPRMVCPQCDGRGSILDWDSVKTARLEDTNVDVRVYKDCGACDGRGWIEINHLTGYVGEYDNTK